MNGHTAYCEMLLDDAASAAAHWQRMIDTLRGSILSTPEDMMNTIRPLGMRWYCLQKCGNDTLQARAAIQMELSLMANGEGYDNTRSCKALEQQWIRAAYDSMEIIK